MSSISSRSFIEIWSQLMCLLTRRARPSWVIWMCRKWGICVWPRPGPPIMPVLRCGRICHMIISPIYGRWAVCCMRWLCWRHRLRGLIWKICIRILLWKRFHLSRRLIRRIWSSWLIVCLRRYLLKGRQLITCSKTYSKSFLSSSTRTIFWEW